MKPYLGGTAEGMVNKAPCTEVECISRSYVEWTAAKSTVEFVSKQKSCGIIYILYYISYCTRGGLIREVNPSQL